MHREIKKETTAAQIVIRLLNGMLKGCEFDLASGKTLFIVAKENEVLTQQHLPIFPENTIFIPVTSAGSNFEINIDDQTPANVLLRELNNEDDSEKNKAASILFNQIITVGEVVFAVKEINSEWAEEILLYPGKEKEKTTPLPLAKKSRAALWCSLSAVTLISAIIVANLDYRDSKQKQSGELSSLLVDNEGKYHIFHGHDGWIYILANNEKEVAWARQSLIRLHFSKPVRVLSLQSEEQRIGLWLTENWPTVKYHRIRIETPQSPVILISEERSQLNDQQRAQLIKNLNQQIPYAEQSQLLVISDTEVAYQAEAGIKKMAIPYTRNDNSGSVTFIIQGSLDDGQLQQLRSFVTDYMQTWGEHYVQFSVELKDDWLKGKSFKYGDQGYIKVAPGYWYFPKPL